MSRVSAHLTALVFTLAVAAPAVAAPSRDCGPPPDGALCVAGAWLEFASMDVTLRQGTVTSRFEVTIAAGSDVLARADETTPSYRGKSSAILIGGSVLGTLSDPGLPSTGMQLLDDPVLGAKEAASLLQLVRPRGPRSVTARTPVRLSGTRAVQVAMPTMTSFFGPPWTIEGWIAPAGNGAYNFDLAFTFRLMIADGSVSTQTHVHRYEGRVSLPAQRPRLPDSLSLDGWTLEGAQGGTFSSSTLGDVRRKLGITGAR